MTKKIVQKIDAYERVIAAYLENPNKEILTDFIYNKFRNKSVSFGTVCNARQELFNLMIYLENHDLFNSKFRDTIGKVMEDMYIDGNDIKYKHMK